MLTKRIIPCLDVRDGEVVKGVKFKDIKRVDSVINMAKFYSNSGADELVFYDITASHEKRGTSKSFVTQVADEINIPFCVGGGVRTLEDFDAILKAGADKVSINSSAINTPDLITKASEKYGAQCVVVSMDVKWDGDQYSVYQNGGRIKVDLEAISWAKKAVELGAGELVINSIDEDGVGNGYDTKLLKAITSAVSVPVIASGGAGSLEDFYEGSECNVDGLLAASVFHYGQIKINDLKQYLKDKNIPVRLR